MSKVSLNFNEPLPLKAEEDHERLAAIDRGIQCADENRTVSFEEARKLIPEWTSQFELRTKRFFTPSGSTTDSMTIGN
ncbi:MAG TPA: hypothetical protein VG273_13175 [Bryobacteraceae bacterium]|jgi:hypothetical protein|nr:hypothetical protein [Bryobacteraceae bacterium]